MTQKNGNGKTAEAVDTSKGKTPELSNVVIPPKTEEKVSLTINQKIEKINNLYNLMEKREKLTETKENLNRFRVSADGNSQRMTIKDGFGAEFNTSNASVIIDVVALIKKVVDTQIKEVEDQINF